MQRSIKIFFRQFFCWMLITACGPEIEVGYKPPIAIPVRVAINTSGEISVGFSGDFVTPIGTFDISGGTSIDSLRERYNSKVLIVRIDDEALVYQLEEGKEFTVNFDDDNTLYRKVALIYESDGDIVLELESAQEAYSSQNNDEQTNPQPSDPELFIRNYFYEIVHNRDYQYLWTLATENFQQKNSDGSYQDFVDFWNSVEDVEIESLNFYERNTYSVKCNVNMTMYINSKAYPLNLKYHLIYDTNRETWLFESP